MDSRTPSSSASTGANASENAPAAHSVRQKVDPAWQYCVEIGQSGKNKILQCTLCEKVFKGGGINRVKQHLARKKGEVVGCVKVTKDISDEMNDVLATRDVERQIKMEMDDMFVVDDDETIGGSGTKKMKTIGSYMKGNASLDLKQPSIKEWQNKERKHEADMSVALWFYDACIPFNAVNSEYFKAAMNKVATMGSGYTGPTYHALRVPLLKEAKTQVSLSIDALRSRWVKEGCTIMGDGWTDNRGRSLINFLVYSPNGISFIESCDVSNIASTADNLYNLFARIIEYVGKENVVHVVSDNAANYKAAGAKIHKEYPKIFWSPCSAHCINLMLHDIGKMERVSNCIFRASRITVFVYNTKWTRGWLRERPGWTDIITPGATRFGTSFIALKSLYDHKHHLEALVIDPGFRKFLRTAKGKRVKDIVFDSRFWNNCLLIVKVTEPLMRLLRICDTDEKPSLGYVFEGLTRAVNGTKAVFNNVERRYKPFVDIIEERWDKMLRKDLHAAAYWLNPTFQYDRETPMPSLAYDGFLDLIQELYGDSEGVTSELTMFREAQGRFGMSLAQKDAKRIRPDEWWRIFGNGAPNLQNLAIRLLSQTSSSSGCERNWSVFERIHTKKRNRLEHQRLNDLVFVHYNLRLKNRPKKVSYDPIDIECVDRVDHWVIDEEPNGELDYDELERLENGTGDAGESSQCVEGNQGSDNILDTTLLDDDDPMRGDDQNWGCEPSNEGEGAGEES